MEEGGEGRGGVQSLSRKEEGRNTRREEEGGGGRATVKKQEGSRITREVEEVASAATQMQATRAKERNADDGNEGEQALVTEARRRKEERTMGDKSEQASQESEKQEGMGLHAALCEIKKDT